MILNKVKKQIFDPSKELKVNLKELKNNLNNFSEDMNKNY